MFTKKSIFGTSVLVFKLMLWMNPIFCVSMIFSTGKPNQHFNLNSVWQDERKTEFGKFWKKEIFVLAKALRIPGTFTFVNGTVASDIECLCFLVIRFRFPCRFSNIIPWFGRSVPETSLILSEVCNFIYDTHRHLLSDLMFDLVSHKILLKKLALKNIRINFHR